MKLRTLTEAAKLLGISRRRLRAGIEEGRYPAMEWGNRLLVDVDVLAKIIAEERRKEASGVGWVGLRECAEAIGVSTETLRRMAQAGVVPYKRHGRFYRFQPAEVEAAIRRNMT